MLIFSKNAYLFIYLKTEKERKRSKICVYCRVVLSASK